MLCGRCVEACQNVEVNETLSINWDPNPRVLWDRGSALQESCGHCVTVCPCNALMEKSMLGHAGFLTSLKKSTLKGTTKTVFCAISGRWDTLTAPDSERSSTRSPLRGTAAGR